MKKIDYIDLRIEPTLWDKDTYNFRLDVVIEGIRSTSMISFEIIDNFTTVFDLLLRKAREGIIYEVTKNEIS